MQLPVMPPIKPMLAKATSTVPEAEGLLYEPKWDGYRCLVFRDGDEVELASRGQKSLTRYFPELIDPILAQLPKRCVVDCELVVFTLDGLDFDVLGNRIHPAESRIKRLSTETPASLVAFDLLALDQLDLRTMAFSERRGALEALLDGAAPPVHLSPITDDPEVARDWFARFEGAGFDGVMAKPSAGTYQEDKRSLIKVKHRHSVDVVVAGYRVHKSGDGVGSMMLGLYDAPEDGTHASLQHVGVASAFKATQRIELAGLLEPYRLEEDQPHPWTEWADPERHADGVDVAVPGAEAADEPQSLVAVGGLLDRGADARFLVGFLGNDLRQDVVAHLGAHLGQIGQPHRRAPQRQPRSHVQPQRHRALRPAVGQIDHLKAVPRPKRRCNPGAVRQFLHQRLSHVDHGAGT